MSVTERGKYLDLDFCVGLSTPCVARRTHLNDQGGNLDATERGKYLDLADLCWRGVTEPVWPSGEALSPFLIGRMFVREPSWEYSANLVGS